MHDPVQCEQPELLPEVQQDCKEFEFKLHIRLQALREPVLLYEGEVSLGNQVTNVTFAKNLESAAVAMSDGVFKMKGCHGTRGGDCFVLIEYY